MPSPDRHHLHATLRELLEPVVERLGCELVALDLAGPTRNPVLRLYIDRAGGIGVDQCAAVSAAVGPVLDVADPFPAAYELEVSSPGIDRPVERPKDFLRFAGFRARVRLAASGRKSLAGVLRGYEDGHVLLETAEGLTRLTMTDIERVRLDLTLEEFVRLGPPAAAGQDPTPL